jgi:hypothetical protein
MASATQINLSINEAPSNDSHNIIEPQVDLAEPVDMDEAVRLAPICRNALNLVAAQHPDFDHGKGYTADEILALPLDVHRVPDELYRLPRRRSRQQPLALALSRLLYPIHEGSLAAVIRYEADRVRLRGMAALQRRYDLLRKTRDNGRTAYGMTGGAAPGVSAPVWASRIVAQGPWDPIKKPISHDGVAAVPMPVKVADGEDLAPFLDHLARGGTHEVVEGESDGVELDNGRGEPYYGVRAAEFRKGVVYEDGRMDLCKMVVGPDHIGNLMHSLGTNEFVRHFLLGNNIIGPVGAEAIARFVRNHPDRMETWYLAGNCIDGPSLEILVDAMVTSPAVTNIWLKRNPLGPGAAHDLFRLVIGAPNLRTLDVDQAELGNIGVAKLFQALAAWTPGPGVELAGGKLPLRNVYLNGNGIGAEAAAAIGSFLTSPHCGVTSLYMSSNPLGNKGIQALATALPQAPQLTRLSLQSVGVSTQGAVALCEGLAGHPGLRMLDIGQAFATEDLGQAYNYIDDDAVPAISNMLRSAKSLEYLSLGHCPITPPGLVAVSTAVLESPSLLYYMGSSVVSDPNRRPATFQPSREQPMADDGSRLRPEILADQAVRAHLEHNVRARYGDDGMTYARFLDDEKRWLINDRQDVRKIDSVYRNRDAGKARRGLMTLVKTWDEGDGTLERVRMAQGPAVGAFRQAIQV